MLSLMRKWRMKFRAIRHNIVREWNLGTTIPIVPLLTEVVSAVPPRIVDVRCYGRWAPPPSTRTHPGCFVEDVVA
jgi:hypothetical protein